VWLYIHFKWLYGDFSYENNEEDEEDTDYEFYDEEDE